VGEALKVSRSYIYQLIAADALEVERLGPRTILVTHDSLIRYLRSQGAHAELNGGELVITEAKVPLDLEKIKRFCQRWGVEELALFGSVLREDFGPHSDVDVLVTLAPDSPTTLLFDHVDMEAELSAIFSREVDLVSRRAIEESMNSSRRQEILQSAEVLYAKAA